MEERNKFIEVNKIILGTVRATEELLEAAATAELDEIFGKVLNRLNKFFQKVEDSFMDFIVFERYITCAYTREEGYSLRNIPEEVKKQVYELKDNDEVCGFTGKECLCKKSIEYLKIKFKEKVELLSSTHEIIRQGSEELTQGMTNLGKNVENLKESIKKIMAIAEIIEIISLNAYIEAARLGESGRGFKIIADEVRKASTRTNEIAHEIVSSIENLYKDFNAQVKKQQKFDSEIGNIASEEKKFRESINEDLFWMAQNFIDFLDYVRNYVREDMEMLNNVRNVIVSALQSIDLTNQRVSNASRALSILATMIDNFESLLKGEKEVNEVLERVKALNEEFKRIPKLKDEREIIARMNNEVIDDKKEVVGEKLEDLETEVELF